MVPPFLNPQQKEAVVQNKGRVLVLAGAGSGKTGVITHRICHLVTQCKVSPSHILGLTFTNKAADEMRNRVASLLGAEIAAKVFLTTFHSFCLYVLRRDICALGYKENFTIYDEHDIKRVLKQIVKNYYASENIPSISPVYEAIQKSKNEKKTLDEDTQEIVERLEDLLKAYNALDFERLLSLTVTLFQTHPEILQKYQDQYQYIMIDEYQDTNPIQFTLAELIAKKRGNLFVVGDDDQSIYGWRGAKVENILQFQADTIIKLEENYRSCQNILDAANHVIQNNTGRYVKKLWSKKPLKVPIHIFHTPNETLEAKSVVQLIIQLKQQGFSYKDMAILYRSNLLSRPFELELLQASWYDKDQWVKGLPYQVFGGLEFRERSEIKDLFAYLRVVVNPQDEDALIRIINNPRRGISDKCISKISLYQREKKFSLWSFLQEISHEKKNPLSLSTKAVQGITDFVNLIEQTRLQFASYPLDKALRTFLEKSHFHQSIIEDVQSEKMRKFKWENVLSCIDTIKEHQENTPNTTLADFLSSCALAKQPLHGKDKKRLFDHLQLMTFHSAKGLEFPICFLVGLEDHIVPHEKSMLQTGIEEERRLFYVALTRCKSHLYLSMARKRTKMGKAIATNPSRFLHEIPSSLLQPISYKNFL